MIVAVEICQPLVYRSESGSTSDKCYQQAIGL
jgi:hypothetical protein